MSPSKIIGGISGVMLLLVGLVGSAVSLLAVLHPVGTQMADDNNPFGPPPSLFGSVLIVVFCLSVAVVGGFVVRKSVRKPRISA
jgi:hypothetical protein